MKAEEVNRYLEYLGCNAQDTAPVMRESLLSRRCSGIAVVVLAVIVLVGVAYAGFSSNPREGSAAIAQTEQTLLEDVPSATPPLTENPLASSKVSDYRVTLSPVSAECYGPWYPILLGLLACPGE